MTIKNIGDELYDQFHIKVKSTMGVKVHNGISDLLWFKLADRIWIPLSDNQGQEAVMVGMQSIKLGDYKK
jgi:hypothetical protein